MKDLSRLKDLKTVWPVVLFATVQAVIYAVMLGQDIATGADTTALRYTGVCLCFAFAVGCAVFRRGDIDCLLTAGALVFTIVSDYFLLVKNDNFEVGVCTFIVAQLLYAVRILKGENKGRLLPSLLLRTILPVIVCVGLYFLEALEVLTVLVAFYFVALVINAVDSVCLKKKQKTWWLLTVGLVLFIGCDICVGLFNFDSVLGVALPQGLYRFVTVGMWAFYLPSQTLIAISVFPFKEKV